MYIYGWLLLSVMVLMLVEFIVVWYVGWVRKYEIWFMDFFVDVIDFVE